MIQLYRDDYFKYDGRYSKDICNIIICNINETDNEVQNGIDRSIQSSDANGFSEVTNNPLNITIKLVKLDEYNNIVGLTESEMFEINRWLLSGEKKYKPLEQAGITYYAMFLSGKQWFNIPQKRTGYLTYDVQILPYCYSTFIEKTIKLSPDVNIKEFNIFNNSNIDENDRSVTMDVSLLDNGDYIKIENLTNGTVMEFMDMSDDETKKFRIISEDLYGNKIHILKSCIDEDYNLMKHCYVRKWIKLFYGMNRLRITSKGYATVNIKYRYKKQIM